MPQGPLFDGDAVKINGEEWIIAPLNLRTIKQLTPSFEVMQRHKASGTMSVELIDAMIKVAHGALLRNYPAMTLDSVEEMLDMGNLDEVVSACLRAAGLVPKLTGVPVPPAASPAGA